MAVTKEDIIREAIRGIYWLSLSCESNPKGSLLVLFDEVIETKDDEIFKLEAKILMLKDDLQGYLDSGATKIV